MSLEKNDLATLNEQLKDHMGIMMKCTLPSAKYGKLLLATPLSRDTHTSSQGIRVVQFNCSGVWPALTMVTT